MTDNLEQLRQALQSAPAPEGDAKARALRLALEPLHPGGTKGQRPQPAAIIPSGA